MKALEDSKDLVWHHTTDFKGPLNTAAAGGEVRMILIPRGYHDSAMLGANHGGGRVVINFHLENGIP